ncbi:MAG: RNA polymerase sigma factor [Alphaproteobacteria bacterium]|nr:RNA polymerase sigma factor [Alphaproteobacteria bacterium]
MPVERVGQQETEKARLGALKSGSAVAWRELLACYGPRLLRYATRMVGARATAEEILQDSLVTVYRTIARFDGRCSLKSWLYRAVHNRAIDELRRRKRYVDVGDDPERDYFNAAGHWQHECPGWDGMAAKRLDDKRLLIQVRDQLDRLPHSHREILLMKEVDGLDPADICAALEITPGNFRLRLHRARAALRAAVVRE